MRLLFLTALVALIMLPLTVGADDDDDDDDDDDRRRPRPKLVEIFNEPLMVDVLNPPVYWQLVGFTSATYKGKMGGIFGVTQKCQLEFTNSRMCLLDEVADTTSIPSGLSGEAWVNTIITGSSSSCGVWQSNSFGGERVRSNGVTGGGSTCSGRNPIACCALVP